MINARLSDPSPPSLSRSLIAPLRALSGSRLGLVLISGAVIVGGLGLNWSWLVAAGIAPLLLSVLPCVAMCALGLCMVGMKGNGARTGSTSDATSAPISAPRADAGGSRPLESRASNDGAFKVE